MITEDYVSFEVAKLLRDKGFDAGCRYYYIQTGEMFEIDTRFHTVLTTQELLNLQIVGEKEERCVAPTLQMAMKWLREVHNIHTEICLYKTNEDDIETKKSKKAPYYIFGVWDTVTGNIVDKRLTNDFIGDTYEEACEAAIKYCLENLI